MLISIVLFTRISFNIDLLLSIFNNKSLNDFINKYGYDIPRIAIIMVGVISLSLLLVYKFTSLSHDLRQNYYEKYREKESANKEYHLYFLFIGVAIIISELIFEFFTIRTMDSLIINIIIGCIISGFYYFLSEIPSLYRNIKQYFILVFILYFFYVCSNIIQYTDNSIPSMGFLVFMFFSYNVIKPIRYYYYFISVAMLFLIITLFFQLIPVKIPLILLNISILIIVINQIKHIVLSNVRDKLRFTNEIVQKGNSLIIACNSRGRCLYCSDSIETILGYTSEEVMGMEYWRLTHNSDFIFQKHYNTIDETKLYTRRLKCKNGDFKYIQWKDKILEDDLIVSMGQDITEQYILKNQFKNLIQTASDLIFEIDKEGYFIFVNNFAIKLLNYSETEIIGKHYNKYVGETYKQITNNFYESIANSGDDFPIIEIPLIKKNGQEIWISQKVIVRKNENGEIIGYSGIARDITQQKYAEDLKNIQLTKINNYNQILKKLSITNFTAFNSTAEVINFILQEAALLAEFDAISFWSYKPQKINCKYRFSTTDNFILSKKRTLTPAEFPIYFESIQNKSQIVISDVFSKYETSEFEHDYLNEIGAKSVIDSTIYVNGSLVGIVCLESVIEKKWDNEDANFAKTIADIISLGIATQKRLKNQLKLKKRSNLLSALALCTKKFLSNKTTTEMLSEAFEIIGKASESDHLFYYEKDRVSGLISQKIKWSKVGIENQVAHLHKFTNYELSEILQQVKKKSILQISTKDLKNTFFKNLLINNSIKSIIVLPIYVNENLIGFIGIDNCKKQRKWKKDDLYILQTLINNISNVLEKAKNEQKILEGEEKFRLITNNIPGTVYISKFDSFSTKIFLSDEIVNLTGYSKSEFLDENISFLSLMHPEGRDAIIKKQRLDLQAGKSIRSKYQIKKKSGEYIWIEEYADIIKRGDEIDYVGGIYFDITNKEKYEETIKAAKLAENTNNLKLKLLANMWHEITTPLNEIIDFSNLLLKTKLEDTQLNYLENINQSAHSLSQIINNFIEDSNK